MTDELHTLLRLLPLCTVRIDPDIRTSKALSSAILLGATIRNRSVPIFRDQEKGCSLQSLQAEVTQRRLKEILKWIDVGRTHEDILAVFNATESI